MADKHQSDKSQTTLWPQESQSSRLPGTHPQMMNFYFSQHRLRAAMSMKRCLLVVCIGYLSVGLQIILTDPRVFWNVLKTRNRAAGKAKECRGLLAVGVSSLLQNMPALKMSQ